MKSVLALVIFGQIAFGQTMPNLTPDQKDYGTRLIGLITHHPEPVVNTTLAGWLRRNRVMLAPERTGGVFATAENAKWGPQVYLWFDSNEFPMFLTAAEQGDLMRLNVYRESLRIVHNFDGSFKLPPLAQRVQDIPKTAARAIWNEEWRLAKAETSYVQKIGKPYLMPLFAKYFSSGANNDLSFLEDFYQQRKESLLAKLNPGIGAEFQSIYQREKVSLVTPAKR